MFYIVVLHALGAGGILSSTLDSSHFFFAWFIETFAYCAVNCFGLISGYVGYREDKTQLKVSHYIRLWLQVVFYGLFITLIFHLFSPDKVMLIDYLKSFFPVTFNLHWYFTAYTGLFFVIPMINAAVQKLENRSLKILSFFCILLFSVFPLFSTSFYGDTFVLKNGYSFLWLAILYFLGAVMKKTGMFLSISGKKGILYIFLLVIFTEIWSKYGSGIPVIGKYISLVSLITYISPTILAIAVFHVSIFEKIQLSDRMVKLVKFAAPGTFSVYLINTQKYVWQYIMTDKFEFLSNSPLYLMPIIIAVFSLSFVCLSILLDRLRQILFEMIQIDKYTNKVDKCLENYNL